MVDIFSPGISSDDRQKHPGGTCSGGKKFTLLAVHMEHVGGGKKKDDYSTRYY